MAKDAMSCSQCQGQGCQACQGNKSGRFSEKKGNGMGPGRGAAVVVGEADGANIRGQVAEAIKEEMAAQGSQPADPLVIDQLPKSRREHAQEYFNLLREGR